MGGLTLKDIRTLTCHHGHGPQQHRQ